MDPKLELFLSRVSQRLQRLRFGWLLVMFWSVAFLCLAIALICRPSLFFTSNQVVVGLGSFIASGVAIAWLISRAAFRDRRWLAAQVERCHPSLKQRLITAVSSSREESSSFLRKSLTQETLLHAYIHDWNEVVSKRSMRLAWGAQFVALFFVIAIVISATSMGSAKDHRLLDVFAPVAKVSIEVQPGNAEVERGTNCLVTVRFKGDVPDQVTLSFKAVNDTEHEPSVLPMQRSLSDPVYAGYLSKVSLDTEYQIDFEHGRSESYRLKVFDFPALLRSDVEIAPPAYAMQEKRIVKDTRRVTVPERTSLTWFCNVNKPLASVELVDEEGVTLALSAEPSNELVYKGSMVIDSSRKWKVRLKDTGGRSAKIEETLTATVLPNKPPEIKAEKITDATVSALEELSIQAKVRDDYSLMRAGVQFSLASGNMEERVLLDRSSNDLSASSAEVSSSKDKPTSAREASIKHLLDFEKLGSEPDQLLSYYFWAEDMDQAGQIRRIDGEIYFAEVRPFDEIFREGESPQGASPPPGKQSPQAQKAEELAELQKKIISGTWNVIRAQKSPSLSQKNLDDVEVLSDSQDEALKLALELEEKIKDEQSRKHLNMVLDAMEAAIKQLDDTVSNKEVGTLKNALKLEQNAYEGLLRLRAREHQIVQSKKPSSKASNASQKNRQKQLEQLELKDDSERYETQREAEPESEAADREMRQVMSRLDEIARRQEDINRQLKDIETAIQAAKTEEEKKELEEQLKRLRENQEELLRDTDELVNRMQSSEQSSEQSNKQSDAMEQAQQQVAEAREEIRKAAESLSLSKPSASQALSSGTRAEKKIEETRDQLREQSAQRFEETMKSMLNRARELEKDQAKLSSTTLGNPKEESDAKKGDESEKENDGGLRPGTTGETKDAPSRDEAFKEQREKLNELLQQMQDTVTEAEPSEPLMAEKLYETFRETKQRDIENRLDLVPRLVERGLAAPVEQTLEEIETGMRELREGVELAAESVLGNEVDGLRRALNELERLEKQVQEEITLRNRQPEQGERSPTSNADTSEAKSTDDKNGKGKASSGKQSDESAKQPSKGSPSESDSGKKGSSSSQSKGNKQASQSRSEKGSPQNGNNGNNAGNRSTDQNSSANGVNSLTDIMERSAAPITGNNFNEWSDALRDVEESVRDPEMRGVASGIRQAAREMHRDYVRHSKEPQWDLVRELVAKPLAQLQETVQAELLRKSADRNAVVPIDRDPVPTVYEQQLRRYYENLGSQKATKK